ncbi:uncharacterized protein C12orf56 homolog [Antennarius striatus]|uniref:uncharacterized protein C12orf56 homolog n=1 Tax=Antennarius striatus TaxID=241820 RepID=UPI0035AF8A6E
MARFGSDSLPSRRNMKLDAFLKRNMDRAVYERIRSYEPCVVISDTINKMYMHVVLTDTCVYLTEYPPRALTAAFNFRRVRDIELVNDLPDFLHGKHRELCQHIRISYFTDQPTGRQRRWLGRDQTPGTTPATSSSQRSSRWPSVAHSSQGYPTQGNHSEHRTAEVHILAPVRSTSCPHPETLGLPRVPQPPSTAPLFLYSSTISPKPPLSPSNEGRNTPERGQVSRSIGSVLTRLVRQDHVSSEEKRETDLHLYAVSHTSRLYFHLQSLWNSFIIRSTLLLDPLYRGRCRVSTDSSPGNQNPPISWERTANLFAQLSSELLREGLGVESLYLLLQELRTAAHRNVALCRLFWRSRQMCVFLVETLEDSLRGRGHLGVYTADQLLLSTLITQTLAVMFRQTEVEPSRLNLLSAEKGALASRMLLSLICDPRLQTQNQSSEDSELQVLLSEYLDASCSLLFEMLLFGHEASRCSSTDNFLSVGWILRVLQPHPHLMSFIDHQAHQVVLVLSDQQKSFLSPFQSVLLFQRCYLLQACLRHGDRLAQHLRSHFREEFRYSVKPSCAEEKLLPHYPISQPTLRLVELVLALHR